MKSKQEILFDKVRAKIPTHHPAEFEVAGILGITVHEAFALMRGQSEISLEAAYKLANRYGLSIDNLERESPSVIPFQFRAFDYNIKDLDDFFIGILEEFRNMDLFGTRKLTYAASEFPLFTLFQFPVLAAFKLFFWGKTVYDLAEFKDAKFYAPKKQSDTLLLGERSWKQYLKIDSVEIWSSEIVNAVLKEVYYCWSHDLFKSSEDALAVCDSIIELLEHTEKQAAIGRKFHPNKKPPKNENFQLFYNDVSVSNNTIMISSERRNMVFISQNTLNYLATDNEIFHTQTQVWIHRLTNQSHNITQKKGIEKRTNFFNQLKSNVVFVKKEIGDN
jgi:hypothetical protein